MSRVRQLTSHPSINHPAYFLERSFTEDGLQVLFTSYRTGAAQLFLVPLEGGELEGSPVEQLTFGEAVHPYSAAIRGQRLFFVRGSAIFALDLKKRVESQVTSLPGASLGEVAPDARGEWLVAAAKQGSQHGLFCGKSDGTAWQLIPFPRTVIHPQFHPLEPEWIEFAADPAPRMFRVRRHGGTPECLYEHGNDEFVVHETFLGETGDLVFTVWPKAVCRMDWNSRKIATVCEFNAWHISPDAGGRSILCDTNHPDSGIWRIDTASGERTFVCQSNSSNKGTQWCKSSYALAADFVAAQNNVLSWMETAADTVYGPQWTHPHPAFSRDERSITFTSDQTGFPQVYVADL